MSLLLWTAIIILACALIGRLYLSKFSEHRAQHREHAEGFYRAAQKVLDADDEIPDPVLDVLENLGRDVRSGTLPWRLVWAVASGRVLSAAAREPSRAEILSDSISSMRPELAELTRLAIMKGVLAMTYRSVIAGTMLRRGSLFAMRASQKRVTGTGEAESLYLDGRGGFNSGNGVMPA